MTITLRKLHFLLLVEIALLNLLILPLSVGKIKQMYGDYNMTASYFYIVGILLLITNIFIKYVKPYIEKYHSNNKKLKTICSTIDLNISPKKIFDLEKDRCLSFVFYYSIFILFCYPILLLVNKLIIYSINIYKIIKPKMQTA